MLDDLPGGFDNKELADKIFFKEKEREVMILASLSKGHSLSRIIILAI